MTARPEYRVDLPPAGARYFQCVQLRALLSTKSCAERRMTPKTGSSCEGCALGAMHCRDHGLVAPGGGGTPCTRCGRSDLRLIGGALCVSCKNREYEWIKGRNAKGRVPLRYAPPRLFEVGIRHANGRTEVRAVEALHGAEAVGSLLRNGLGDARFVDVPRPGATAWNAQAGCFEHVCDRCGVAGLILERVRGDVLERRCWSCNPDMDVTGWRVSPVRQPLLPLDVDTAASWLSSDAELKGEEPGTWTALPHPCACGTGQVEALLAPSGRWRCRCTACTASSEPTRSD